MGKRIKKFARLMTKSIKDSCLILIGTFAGAFLGAYFPKTEANLDYNFIMFGAFIIIVILVFAVEWAAYTDK